MQGYHVSWKKTKHKNNQYEVTKAEKEIINRDQISSLVQEYNELASVSKDNIDIAPTSKKTGLSYKKEFLENEDQPNSKLKTSSTKDVPKNIETKKPIGGGGGGKAASIALIILGLLLFGLGYIFYTNIGVLLGTIFFMIFGIGGAIFFIIGLVMLLVG